MGHSGFDDNATTGKVTRYNNEVKGAR